MLDQLEQWDRQLFVFFNGLGVERYDAFWIFITQEQTWIPLYLFIIFVIFRYYSIKNAVIVTACLLLTFLITFGFTDVVKELVARVRPSNNEALSKIIRILQKPTFYSFFSGHASSSMAVTTFFVLSIRNYSKLVYLTYIWPLLFMVSRIYVGVHYPSDLFVGAAVGTVFAFAAHYLCIRFIYEKNNFKDDPIDKIDGSDEE